MRAHFRNRALSIIAVLAIFPVFQNCGEGFKPAGSIEISSQCSAKMKADVASLDLDTSTLACGDARNYECEVRLFSPEAGDQASVSRECLSADDSKCVRVTLRQFNTSGARDPAGDPSDFEPGGTYNREEVRCHHTRLFKGVALFEGEADTLVEALDGAIAACRKAGS